MKSKDLNNSSRKTKKLIKKIFAKMLAEKKELALISVSELCSRAEISRGAFYSHYNDIYGVAEDYENELIDFFFDNANFLSPTNIDQFIDAVFDYLEKNNENYVLLCNSNDFLYTTKRLNSIVCDKLIKLCAENPFIKNKNELELEINVFIDGLFCEYVKLCRNYSTFTLDDLEKFTKNWVRLFKERRFCK